MASVEDYTDPYLAIYTPVPTAGEGTCDICHGFPSPGYRRCWSCSQTMRSVSRPVPLVVPISLYRVGGQLHSDLRGYKSSLTAIARRRLALRVGATLHRFMRDHVSCIEAAAEASWDAVTIVPSKSRTGEHPLEEVIRLGKRLKRSYRPLLEPNRPDQISRARGSDDGFRPVEDVEGLCG